MPSTQSARLLAGAVAALLAASLVPAPAAAQAVDPAATDLPFFAREVPRGTWTTESTGAGTATPKAIDGDIGDWTGDISRYGGTMAYSNGELVYQDHLFDAHGPDDGRDRSRIDRFQPVEGTFPEIYRIEALAQADVSGELGIPAPEEVSYNDSFGDADPHQDQADLVEVRVARAAGTLNLLARTTTMTTGETALLVLADTGGEPATRTIPFNAGITSGTADLAFFLTGTGGAVADLSSGAITALGAGSVATNTDGFTNAIEAALPLADGPVQLAIASGMSNASDGFAPLTIETNDEVPHANLANVAFRADEPSRVWFDRNQALALHGGSIDEFFLALDDAKLASAVRERVVPGTGGYHDRIFISSDLVAREGGRNGRFQHYGVYLPSDYTGEPVPLQWWLHWRGGNAHSGAAIVPRVFKHFGENFGSIVVSPSGRGTGRWYVGQGHVDILEVWADVFDTFAIQRDKVYVSGHSMGGFGSYLLTTLYPDRFAAAAPVAGPVTQGAWTGIENCNSGCYIEANGSRARIQHTRKLLENVRYVPYAILHGTDDELVPYTGVARQAERLTQLGYRHRFYTYPGYEHYSHPVMDQWAEAARYLHTFAVPAHPRRVTFKRDMPLEIATEEVQSGDIDLNFDFDSAYWMSGLTAADELEGTAAFDGTSLAVSEVPTVALPDAGGPASAGATGPYIYEGLQWLSLGAAPPVANAFDVTLTGARAVELNLAGMSIDAGRTVTGEVGTDHALSLSLDGGWTILPGVEVDGQPADATLSDGVITVSVPSGDHTIRVIPRGSIAFTPRSATSGQATDTALLEVEVRDAFGEPFASAPVTFEITGPGYTRMVEAVTGGNGIAQADVLLDLAGDFSVTASGAGVSVSSPLTVVREDTALGLNHVDGKIPVLVATLNDADAGGIGGQTIEFFADGQPIGTALTGADGNARIETPKRARKKGTVYSATYAGNDTYRPSGTR
jgi:poly(3-hydroxybutyrate) depolymerase